MRAPLQRTGYAFDTSCCDGATEKQDRRATRRKYEIFRSKKSEHTICRGSTDQTDRVYIYGRRGKTLL